MPAGGAIVVPPGFNEALRLPSMCPWPPGYKVASGQPGGAFPSSSTNPSTCPIAIQPPISGNGILKLYTDCDLLIDNSQNLTTAIYACGLGVAWPSGPIPANQPMWPYLGVGHAQGINDLPLDSIPAGQCKWYHCKRLDIVDNDFIQNQPVPTWPKWSMEPNTSNLLYPVIIVSFKNASSVLLTIRSVLIDAFAT